MQELKHFVQAVLRRVGLHQRLRASRVYDLYWRIADKRRIEARDREVDFYRGLFNGLHEGDLVFDVGANDGTKTDVFLRLGARVLAIEPDERNQEILREKFLRFRLVRKPVVIVGKAVSDRATIETMWIDGPGSAVNTLSQKWVETLRDNKIRFENVHGMLDFAQQNVVETTTLERLILAHGHPFFVKIDVEGYEGKVLRGLKRPVPFLSFEVNLPEFRPEALECVKLLEELATDGEFNYTANCQQGLVLRRWLDAGEFSQLLEKCAENTIEVFWKTHLSAEGRASLKIRASCASTKVDTQEGDILGKISKSLIDVEIALLTGCQDRPYAYGLAMALVSKGLSVDVIGGDEMDSPDLHTTPNLNFLNFGGAHPQNASLMRKVSRLLVYYARLMRYSMRGKPKILHILWNNKFEYLDRTLLMLCYKLRGKKIVLTAHNVNQARRDSGDSLLNRFTLKIQYRLADHIFLHTQKMKTELLEDFGVRECAVTVIRHPVNNAFPDTELTPAEAKRRLDVGDDERTILFFGRIRPYKGIEHLLTAFQQLATGAANYRLIIAGEPKKGSEKYLNEIRRTVSREFYRGKVILKVRFIPDDEMELYLKAADVLVLPYREIFQSGVLFLGYSFGLPVVATDVGSFREEIIEGRTGFLCKPDDPSDLANALETYFKSDLYRDLKNRRLEIKDYAHRHHSWEAVGELTRNAYAGLLEKDLL